MVHMLRNADTSVRSCLRMRSEMRPVGFKESNVTFAKDQPQYNPLPAHRTEDGRVTSCWTMTFLQRVVFLFRGKFYLTMSTFNQPLQPISMSLNFDNEDK